MKTTLILIIFLAFSLNSIYAQEEHHNHEHSRNEIGFSGGALYGFEHRECGGGLHLHYFRTFKPESRWSLGGGMEQAWLDGAHFNISAGIKYQLIDRLSISLLPGASFATNAHGSSKAQFTLHSELVYDIFHWDKYHLGIVADYSWEKHDQHAMLGIHAAYCF